MSGAEQIPSSFLPIDQFLFTRPRIGNTIHPAPPPCFFKMKKHLQLTVEVHKMHRKYNMYAYCTSSNYPSIRRALALYSIGKYQLH